MVVALIESPLQFLSALEVATPANSLTTYCYDSSTMREFIGKLPLEYLRGVHVKWGQPTTEEVLDARELYVGDLNSGMIQRLLLSARCSAPLPPITVVDDGLATVSAMANIVDARPLVRAKVRNSPARIALGRASTAIIRQSAKLASVRWVTALNPEQALVEQLNLLGISVETHTFAKLRSYCWSETQPRGPFVIGTAMVADDLIDSTHYLQWLESRAEELGGFTYFAHRRETDKALAQIATINGVAVEPAGLPVEIRLANAPAGSVIYSLPTTAVDTLPITMDSPVLHTVPVPYHWWKPSVPQHTRITLNAARRHNPNKPVIVSISDSESYLKWSAAMLEGLSDDFETHAWLLDNPILPTQEQITNALAGTTFAPENIPVIKRAHLKQSLAALRPDIVLASATGPIVQQIYSTAAFLPHRPGLVSGLPGVGLPATSKGQRYRRLGDLFIAHSEFERQRYEEVISDCGFPVEVVVARLPMLKSIQPPLPTFSPGDTPSKLVFAPQAKVPVLRADRIRILRSLAHFATNFPQCDVIIKVRSRPGEQETHREQHTYVDLLDELESTQQIPHGVLRIAVGPMSDYLTQGTALVTVSSTAALESLDRGLATLIISDFGVNEEMLNEAFADSGITARLSTLEAGKFTFPTRQWLDENYFHEPSDRLKASLQTLALRSRMKQLPNIRTEAIQQDYRSIRSAVRSRTPKPVVSFYRFIQHDMINNLKRKSRLS